MHDVGDVNSAIGLRSRGFFQNRKECQLNVLPVKSSESINTGIPLPYQFISNASDGQKEVISYYSFGWVTILLDLSCSETLFGIC